VEDVVDSPSLLEFELVGFVADFFFYFEGCYGPQALHTFPISTHAPCITLHLTRYPACPNYIIHIPTTSHPTYTRLPNLFPFLLLYQTRPLTKLQRQDTTLYIDLSSIFSSLFLFLFFFKFLILYVRSIKHQSTSLSLRRYTIKNFLLLVPTRLASRTTHSHSNTNSHSMASRLTRAMGRAAIPESQTLDNTLNPPADPLQADTDETMHNLDESQPEIQQSPATPDDDHQALLNRIRELENELATARARIQDLTEINSLLRTSRPALPVGREETPNVEPLAHPTTLHAERPTPFSRLASPALITCLGESLPPGVGLNKSYTDAPVFDGSDRELYKDWKRAVLRKLKMSACLYPTPEAGVLYMASRLAGVAADILNHAIDDGDPEADDVASAFLLLDDSFQDADEYGTALAAMDRLTMKADDTVDTFLAKWNKLNIKLGRDKNSRPAVTEFRNKLPALITSKLLDLRPTSTLAQLVERARWVEQNLIQLNHSHPRESKPTSNANKTRTLLRSTTTPSTNQTASPTMGTTRIPRLDDAAKQLAREQDLCFRCRKPGHRAASCTTFGPSDRPQPNQTRPPAPVASVEPVKEESEN